MLYSSKQTTGRLTQGPERFLEGFLPQEAAESREAVLSSLLSENKGITATKCPSVQLIF